jgi:hypothetical protein
MLAHTKLAMYTSDGQQMKCYILSRHSRQPRNSIPPFLLLESTKDLIPEVSAQHREHRVQLSWCLRLLPAFLWALCNLQPKQEPQATRSLVRMVPRAAVTNPEILKRVLSRDLKKKQKLTHSEFHLIDLECGLGFGIFK